MNQVKWRLKMVKYFYILRHWSLGMTTNDVLHTYTLFTLVLVLSWDQSSYSSSSTWCLWSCHMTRRNVTYTVSQIQGQPVGLVFKGKMCQLYNFLPSTTRSRNQMHATRLENRTSHVIVTFSWLLSSSSSSSSRRLKRKLRKDIPWKNMLVSEPILPMIERNNTIMLAHKIQAWLWSFPPNALNKKVSSLSQ